MSITAALTKLLQIGHPVLSAPMAVSGAVLSATVTQAGRPWPYWRSYSDRKWLERELAAAGDARIGVDFITWRLADQPELLDLALDHAPAAIFLSFGDLAPYTDRIARSSSLLIGQVQTVEQAKSVIDQGADIHASQHAQSER